MKLEKLQPGMTVYDVHPYRMGNTSLRSIGVWAVSIIEVDTQTRSVIASWNGNKPTRMWEREWKKLRLKEPELERDVMGRMKLKKRTRPQE